MEFAPRGGRCPRGGDLVRSQQAGQLQDVGSPVLLPLEWAEVLGRRADPISDGGVWGGVPPALRRSSRRWASRRSSRAAASRSRCSSHAAASLCSSRHWSSVCCSCCWQSAATSVKGASRGVSWGTGRPRYCLLTLVLTRGPVGEIARVLPRLALRLIRRFPPPGKLASLNRSWLRHHLKVRLLHR